VNAFGLIASEYKREVLLQFRCVGQRKDGDAVSTFVLLQLVQDNSLPSMIAVPTEPRRCFRQLRNFLNRGDPLSLLAFVYASTEDSIENNHLQAARRELRAETVSFYVGRDA
jgi:hypothetical protein